MNLALRPYNFSFLNQAIPLLQRDLLYFDQVHMCSYTDINALQELKNMDKKQYKFIRNEFDFLRDKKLLFDFKLTPMIEWMFETSGVKEGKINLEDGQDFMDIMKLFLNIRNMLEMPGLGDKYPGDKKVRKLIHKYKEIVDVSEIETTRVSAILLNRFATKDEAFPLLFNAKANGVAPNHKSPVLEVILESLPVPVDNLPWEQVLEYRSDPESQRKFTALRVWMQDIVRKDYSKKEIEERILHMTNEYERHMKIHDLKTKRGTLKVVLVTSLETIENLVKFKWSKSVESLFTLFEKKYDLIEAEMKAPGKEIAYILDAQKKLKK